MKIERTSVFTGATHSMEIKITKTQLEDWFSGQRVINPEAYKNLTQEEIDFITLGTNELDVDLALSQVSQEEILAKDEDF